VAHHYLTGESKEIFFNTGPDTLAVATDGAMEKVVHPGIYQVRRPHTRAQLHYNLTDMDNNGGHSVFLIRSRWASARASWCIPSRSSAPPSPSPPSKTLLVCRDKMFSMLFLSILFYFILSRPKGPDPHDMQHTLA
jgi:hypothetical protein